MAGAVIPLELPSACRLADCSPSPRPESTSCLLSSASFKLAALTASLRKMFELWLPCLWVMFCCRRLLGPCATSKRLRRLVPHCNGARLDRIGSKLQRLTTGCARCAYAFSGSGGSRKSPPESAWGCCCCLKSLSKSSDKVWRSRGAKRLRLLESTDTPLLKLQSSSVYSAIAFVPVVEECDSLKLLQKHE